MSKFSILFSTVLFLGIVALVVLFGLGALPQPVYTFVYQMEDVFHIGGGSVIPSLEKFEGNWDVTLNESPAAQSADSICVTIVGNLAAHNGNFNGRIGPFGNSYLVQASTTEDGNLSGLLTGSELNTGNFFATLYGTSGTGTWSDTLGCQGTVTFTKTDPAVDPIQGHIVSFQGAVELTRNGQVETPTPSEFLYAGDSLTVNAGGTALLSMGLNQQPVMVPSGTTYVVQNTVAY